MAVALGLLDAVELMTWGDPSQLPAHLSPWNDSGLPLAEFTVMRGVDLYYQYLNGGFRLPIAAGTDKVGDDVPLGSNRTYVAARSPLGHASWIEGVRSGRGFVTNAPMLEFGVDGHGPGETVELSDGKTRQRIWDGDVDAVTGSSRGKPAAGTVPADSRRSSMTA